MQCGSYDPVVLAAIDLGHVTSNHDVPLHSVVAPAVGRLVGAQLVEAHGDGYRVTPVGRSVLEGVGHVLPRREYRRQMDVLGEKDWDAAVDRYVSRHRSRPKKGPRSWFSPDR